MCADKVSDDSYLNISNIGFWFENDGSSVE